MPFKRSPNWGAFVDQNEENPLQGSAVTENWKLLSRQLNAKVKLVSTSVFEKPDVSFGQSLYRASLRVQDRHIENHEIDVDGDLLSHQDAAHRTAAFIELLFFYKFSVRCEHDFLFGSLLQVKFILLGAVFGEFFSQIDFRLRISGLERTLDCRRY